MHCYAYTTISIKKVQYTSRLNVGSMLHNMVRMTAYPMSLNVESPVQTDITKLYRGTV